MKITAANRDLHSGIYGGGARNPIRVLTNILGKLHDDNGRITIPGFYDGVKDLPPIFWRSGRALGLTAESFLKPIGLSIPAGETDRELIEQITSRPTCDINGIVGGYTGEGSKTVIARGCVGEGVVPHRRGSGPGEDPRCVPRLSSRRDCPADCTAEFLDHLQCAGHRARLER